jgi:two-component system, OmpR family, response regulator MprA
LELLVRNADIVLSRSQIYEDIWGYDFESSSKSLDVHIGYLRRKLESDGALRLLHTVRGVGYVVRPSAVG